MLRLAVVVLRLVHGKHEWRRKSIFNPEVPNRQALSNSSSMMNSNDQLSSEIMSPGRFPSGEIASTSHGTQPVSAECSTSTLSRKEEPSSVTPAFVTPQGEIKIDKKKAQLAGRTSGGHLQPAEDPTAWHACDTEATLLSNAASSQPEKCAGHTKEVGASFNLFDSLIQPEKGDGGESGEPQTVSTATKEQPLTASSMRRRSHHVADRLVSILRPSSTTTPSKCSPGPKPVALRRLKTTYGVGDDLDSDMEDYDSLSRFLQIQHRRSESGQLPHSELEFQNGNRCISSAFSYSSPSRQRPSIFSSILSTAPTTNFKRHSVGPMKFSQQVFIRPDGQSDCISPRSHRAARNSLSMALNCSVIAEQGVTSESIYVHEPTSGFCPNLTQRHSIEPSSPMLPGSCNRFHSSFPRSTSHREAIKTPTAHGGFKTHLEDPKFFDQQEIFTNLDSKEYPHDVTNPVPKSLYAMNSEIEINELEPRKKVKKLSVTNPDVELMQPGPEPKLSSHAKRPTHELPDGTNSTRFPLQARKAQSVPHLSNWPPSNQRYRGSSSGRGLDLERKGVWQEKTEHDSVKLVSHRLSQQLVGTVGKSSDENKRFSWFQTSSKLSKRKSWLNTSSHSSFHQQLKSTTCSHPSSTKKPNRLKKSFSVSQRINSLKKTSRFLPIPDFSLPSHDLRNQPAGREVRQGSGHSHDINEDINALNHEKNVSPTIHHQEDCSKRRLNTRTSLSNMLKFFTKSKKSVKMDDLAVEDQGGITYGGSTTIRVLSTPSSFSFEDISINSLEEVKGQPFRHPNTTNRPKTFVYPDRRHQSCAPHIQTNPYISTQLVGEERGPPGHVASHDGHFSWIQMHWKSRINSVGSFVNDTETINQTSHSGLKITNPDLEY